MSLNRAAKVLARTRREIQRSKTRTSAFESSRALSCGCNVRRTEDSTPDIFTAALVATAAAGTLCSASCTRENSACDAKRNFTPFQPLTSKAEPRRFKTMHQPRNVMLHRMRSAAGPASSTSTLARRRSYHCADSRRKSSSVCCLQSGRRIRRNHCPRQNQGRTTIPPAATWNCQMSLHSSSLHSSSNHS